MMDSEGFRSQPRQFRRCFISAPFGRDLEALPSVLADREIEWEWGQDPAADVGLAQRIRRAEFVVGILDGAKNDDRVLFEIGVAAGLEKPILLLLTKRTQLPISLAEFSIVNLKLSERDALAFQLEIFLRKPHESIFSRGGEPVSRGSLETPDAQSSSGFRGPSEGLELRVFQALQRAGGSVISQPQNDGVKFRPDMLFWLPTRSSELFDPAVLETRYRVKSADEVNRLETRLRDFMYAGGIRAGIIVTQEPLPFDRKTQSPVLFWLQVDEFETLLSLGQLEGHLLNLRNRAAHGLR